MTNTKSTFTPPSGFKLAYVLIWFPKPSETFIFREVNELRALGVDVEVYTFYAALKKSLSPDMAGYDGPVFRHGLKSIPGSLRAMWYWFGKKPKDSFWALSRFFRRWRSLESLGESFWAIFTGFQIAKTFEERGVTHAHADWASGAATGAWIAARLAGIPFSFCGRAADIYPPDGALTEKARDAVVIRSDVERNVPYFVDEVGAAPEKVKLIHAALTLKSATEAELRFEAPFKLLGVGRCIEKKGFDYLIEAVALLKKRGLDVQLTIAGDGPLLGKLQGLAAELGVAERVLFPGFVSHDRISALFAESDVFVMSSQVSKSGDRDGIPNVIMEAMSHRLPVVGTDVSGIGEVVLDGETGVLAPQQDAEALAEGIAKLLLNRDLAVEYAERGRALVMERFDPKKCALALARMYVGAGE